MSLRSGSIFAMFIGNAKAGKVSRRWLCLAAFWPSESSDARIGAEWRRRLGRSSVALLSRLEILVQRVPISDRPAFIQALPFVFGKPRVIEDDSGPRAARNQ